MTELQQAADQIQQYLELLRNGAIAAIIAAIGVGVVIFQLWHLTNRIARLEGRMGISPEPREEWQPGSVSREQN